MENKINIAELLKDCPLGMELDCAMYDNVTLVRVSIDGNYDSDYPIKIKTPNSTMALTKYGQYFYDDFSKCIIFPKGKTTWEGFVPPCEFKDGDVVTYKLRGSLVAFIYKEKTSTMLINSHFALYKGNMGFTIDSDIALKEEEIVFATEEEKQKLFDAIKKNGYKWNAETKTLEKLIESKEDTDDTNDEVVISGIYFDRKYHADEVELHLNDYKIEIRDGKTYAIFKNQKNKIAKPRFKVGNKIKVINKTYQYVIKGITDTHYTLEEVENKFQYIEPIIEDKNWELIPDKFDITTLKPFESRVLVRDDETEPWSPAIWGFYDASTDFPYIVVGVSEFKMCIPYEGNEHLLGTTDDCEEYYKTWEE